MKRKIRLLLAVVLAMAMVMGSSVTALAKDFTGCSSEAPYRISTMETGDTLEYENSISHKIYVKNDTGRTVYMYSSDGSDSPTQVLFTDKPTYYADFQVEFPNGDKFKLDSDATISWGLAGSETTATVTIRMSAPVPPDNTPDNTPEHVHSFTWQTIYEATLDSDGLEGEVCSCGATRNTQPLSAYGYTLNDYATPMINAAKAGQTITFEFGEWNSFPKSFMAELADKSAQNVTFVFHYNWNHVKQEITIPFGTAVDTGLDWYGPAKMAELYGAN